MMQDRGSMITPLLTNTPNTEFRRLLSNTAQGVTNNLLASHN